VARSLKAARPRSATSSADVEETAAAIIAAVRTGGDDAVREWSQKLDGWSPPSFLLTDKELSEVVRGLPTTVVEDLEYVQKQVWHFPRCQLSSLAP
jgi:sulfopropanediol 3-dehydrogenase